MIAIRSVMCVLFCQILPVQADGFRAGAAQVDITPPTGFAMWGYAARRDLPSLGVRDKLQARALVLEIGKQRIALVGLDLGRAPTRGSTTLIRDRLRKEAGIDTLFLVGSHTHHGPVLEVDTWPTPQTSYVRQLEEKLVAVIKGACKELRPARLGVARKEVDLNRNRHSRLAERPVDRELLVLRLEDGAGKPIAHAVNFAAHPVIVPAMNRHFSADYPGAMCAEVERQTKAPCLFLQGAAGDLSPDQSQGRNTPEKFGLALAREVLELSEKAKCQEMAGAKWQCEQEEFTFASRVDLGNPLLRLALSAAFYPELIGFYAREYRGGIQPQATTALLDGRIGFVGVSGEFFCAHALHLKKRARLEHLFFFGYCNDYQQYFPTIEAASEGGYGTEIYIAPAALGSGERMMDRVLLQLYRMRGKP